jgi:N,N'-diacetyllegionaminate synthase
MKTYIIAEAGVNHNGSFEQAKELIDAAFACGADAVKFQTFKAESLVTKTAKTANYQKGTTGNDSQYNLLKNLELSTDNYKELYDYCSIKGIEFLSTPFDLESVELLDQIGMSKYKISSGDITNLPLLQSISNKGKQVILSTGMSNIKEIEDAVSVFDDSIEITILHANTEYPTPYSDVNLKAMITIGNYFNRPYGYSDHTLGIEVPIAAVAMGASIIEKHFTLDQTAEGPDHKASLNPKQLKDMVKSIRNIELSLGDFEKKASESERKNMSIARKSIVAKTAIKKGDLFTNINLCTKRPGNGISPMKWDDIIGTKALKDYVADDLI